MKQFISKIRHLIKAATRHEQWNIGVCERSIREVLNDGIGSDVTWMTLPNKATFFADPFGMVDGKNLRIFFETFDYTSYKGKLQSCIFAEGKFDSDVADMMDLPVHASFPHVFEHENNLYCTAETQAAREISLFQSLDNGISWKKIKVLVNDFAGVDPTLFFHENKWWLFCTNEDDGKDEKLHIWWADDLMGSWTQHEKNPVKNDITCSRSAGKIFVYEGNLYRPAQDCSKTYGGSITINRITKLTTDDFSEEIVTKLEPHSSWPFNNGLHTINIVGQHVLFDGKRYVFSFSVLLSKIKMVSTRYLNSKKTIKQKRKKVLVLGEDTRSFLSVIRSLGRKGIEVHVAWNRKDDPALFSKYINKIHTIEPYNSMSNSWKKDFVKLLQKENYDLVIPCNDPTLIPIQLHKKELQKHAPIYVISNETFRITSSKIESFLLAKKTGISVADGVVCKSLLQIETIANDFSFPIILKPDTSFLKNNLLDRRSVQKAYSREELFSIGIEMLEDGPILVQKYFIGKGVGIELIAKDGKILSAFQHERIHEPMHGGGSSYRKSVAINQELLEASQKLMKELDYTGVAMVEFKLNSLTGEWVFIEINARFWGSLPLAAHAGIDFPYYLYQMLVEEKTDFPQDYKKNVYARNFWMDAAWARENILADKKDLTLNRIAWSRVLKELFRIPFFLEKNDTFVFDDMRPGFVEIFQIFGEIFDVTSEFFRKRMLSLAISKKLERKKAVDVICNAKNIAFVCKGNINRSAFAEAYAKSFFPSNIKVNSYGYFPLTGRKCPYNALKKAKDFQVDLGTHRSHVIVECDLRDTDLIFVFDLENRDMLINKYHIPKKKIILLGAFSAEKSVIIFDPDKKTFQEYNKCFTMIKEAIDVIIENNFKY